MNNSFDVVREIDELFLGFYYDNLDAFKNRFEYHFEDEAANFWKDEHYYTRILNYESRIIPDYNLVERFNEVDLAEAW